MRHLSFVVVATMLLANVVMAQSPRIERGAVLYVEPTQFGQALSAALIKKEVPVRVTTDRAKADYFLLETHEAKTEGQGERVAKVLVMGAWAGSGKSFEASVSVTDKDGIVLFAQNMKKGNFQSAAEGIAKHIKSYINGN